MKPNASPSSATSTPAKPHGPKRTMWWETGEPLSEKEKTIHDHGLVSVLKQVHDDLDRAVFEAYGWPVTLTDEEILERLVALNAEHAGEESRGLIRWLRADLQAPSADKPLTQTELEMTEDEEEEPSPAPAKENGERRQVRAAARNPLAPRKRPEGPGVRSLPSVPGRHPSPNKPKLCAPPYSTTARPPPPTTSPAASTAPRLPSSPSSSKPSPRSAKPER